MSTIPKRADVPGECQPLAPTRSRQRHQVNSKNPNWTRQEDEFLCKIKSSNENPKWADIMHYFPSKTQHQVNERWEKVLNPDLVKGSWTREEDELIVRWVQEKGTKEWGALAAQLPGRISKQCRERWHNHLCPTVKKSDWTEEEDKILIECQAKWGNKWSKIAELLPGRTDNSVKNRWNSSLKRRLERIQNGQEPNAKRGRKPKRPSEAPAMEMMRMESEVKCSAGNAVAEKRLDDEIPKPGPLDTPKILPTPDPSDMRALFSPMPISPVPFGSPWAGPSQLNTPWGLMYSPMRPQEFPSDLMNIPEPKLDE